jgi:opacity protein-like surface antigen
MKKLLGVCLVAAFVTAPGSLFAANRIPLGSSHLAVKIAHLQFTENDFDDIGSEKGTYFGVEWFFEAVRNLYIGAEVGYTNPDGSILGVNTEVTYVPVELNLKYALEVTPQFWVCLGGGGSYNYGEVKIKAPISDKETDWMLGGQAFIDASLTFLDRFFVGLTGKYQITEKFNSQVEFNNWRVGGHFGITF